MKISVKKLCICAVFTALAIVLSIVENSIPIAATIPGGKLGMANCVIMIMLVFYGTGTAFWICIIKSLLLGFLYSGPMSIIYSLPSSLVAVMAMNALIRIFKQRISMVSLSIAGALCFNIVQVITASVVASNFYVLSYMPLICTIGIIAGFATGLIGNLASKYLTKII